MRGALQYFQYGSRDAVLAFDWLIGIGVGAERDNFWLIMRVRQLLLE